MVADSTATIAVQIGQPVMNWSTLAARKSLSPSASERVKRNSSEAVRRVVSPNRFPSTW
jgi:hypothetical protein